jgi:hypothetical protein
MSARVGREWDGFWRTQCDEALDCLVVKECDTRDESQRVQIVAEDDRPQLLQGVR